MNTNYSKKLVLTLSLITALAAFTPARVLADWLIDSSGTLVKVEGYVLGEDDNKDRVELEKKQLEKETEARKNTLERRQETLKSKLELKDGELKVRQETRDAKGQLRQEKEYKIEAKDKLKLEHREGLVEINAVDGGQKLEIFKEKIRAKTDLPISIGDNNELIVTRPDGSTKVVTILPDQAAEKMRERGLEVQNDQAELTQDENGEPIYEFDTLKEKKFLGIFKASFRHKTKVSAESGDLVESQSTENSPLRRLLERLSF